MVNYNLIPNSITTIILRAILIFVLFLFQNLSFSQFYSFDFVNDQFNLVINDCGHPETALGCLPNIVNITGTTMEFADTEGSNCAVNNSSNNSGNCGTPVLMMAPYYSFEGGANDCLYETNSINIVGRCDVVLSVNYTIVNFSSIISANNLDCGVSNGQDLLILEYSLDNGSTWLPVNPAQPNVICPPASGNISGNTYTFTSPTFNSNTVRFRMVFGIQSVTEGIRINYVRLTETGTPQNPNFTFSDFCQGTSNGPTAVVTPGGVFTFNPSPGDGATINSTSGVILNEVAGTTYSVQYTTPGPCPSSQTRQVTILTPAVPAFNPFSNLCVGDTPPALPNVSLNGISGSWSPATINTSVAGPSMYTFTPTAGQCATTADININVTPLVDPVFNPIGPFCQGQSATPLPLSSTNSITGTWSPGAINTSTAGSAIYTFTPNPGQCASSQPVNITINPPVSVQLDNFGPFCQNSSPPALPSTSLNGITGTWSPPVINTSINGTATYTFNPDPDQCADPASISINITAQITPIFDQITGVCQFDTPSALPTISQNGISGIWTPANIFTNLPGTQTYNFSPSAGQCATVTSMDITVSASITPNFNNIPNQCQFSTPDILPSTSVEGISGTWNPASINTNFIGTTTYTFTPDLSTCSQNTQIFVTVLPNTTPVLPDLGPFCTNDPPTFLPTSINGISGIWYGNGVTSSQFNPASAGNGTSVLTFEPLPDQCATINTTSVVVASNPTGNLSGAPQLCKGQCGTVNFNFQGGSGTFNINMNINVASFNFNFPMIGVTNNTTLTVCYQDNIVPFNPTTNTIYIPSNTPPSTATLTLLNFISTPAGACGNGIVGTPGTISVTLLPEPVANTTSLTSCDTDQDGTALFNLTSVDLIVKNFVAANNVSWYSDNAALNPIPNPNAFLATGITTVYAQVMNPQGCTRIAPVTLTVLNPVIPAVTPFTVCENGSPITLPLNVGGISGNWSDINGYVSSNQFNPTGLPAGNYQITFTPSPGLCAVAATALVNIISTGPIPLPTQIASNCIGTGIINIDPNPGGISGIWSGSPFISGNQFNASASGIGVFQIVFTPDASVGCLLPNSTEVHVIPNTNIADQSLNEICQNEAPFNLPLSLQGYAGNWINDSYVLNNIFTPDLTTGMNQVYNLNFDPDNVCINNINASITVQAPTTIPNVNFAGLCLSSPVFTLPLSVNGITGTWYYLGLPIIQINPSDFGEGNFILTFTPSTTECALPATGIIAINAFTAGSDVSLDYCNSGEDIVNLNNFLTPEATSGGSWTYLGNQLPTPESFDLSTLSPGNNMLNYQLNDPQCGTDDAIIELLVTLPPFAGNNSTLTLCQTNLSEVNISSVFGAPSSGGTWKIPPGLNISFNDLNSVDLSDLTSGLYTFSYNIPAGVCPETSASINIDISTFNSSGPDINVAICEGSTVDLSSYIAPVHSGGILENLQSLSGFDGIQWNTTGVPAGSYPFIYYFTNDAPCPSDTAMINVTLSATLSAGNNVNADFCEASIINLNDYLDNSASPGGVFYYEGNIVPAGIFTPGIDEEFTFEYRVGDGVTCPVSTAIINLTKLSRPDFSASLQISALCPEQITQLSWNFTPQIANAELFFKMTSSTGAVYSTQSTATPGDNILIRTSATGPFNFNNVPLNETFTIRLDSFRILSNGCVFPGNSQTITLTTNDNPSGNITMQLCRGETIVVGNMLFSESNPTGSVIIAAGPGQVCDSIINVNLSFSDHSLPTIIRRTVCDENYSLTVGTSVFNIQNPTGSVLLQNVQGCDSLVNVEITFSSFATGDFNISTCDPTDIFNVGNQQFTINNPSGQVTLTGGSAAGCDSIVNVSIIYLQVSTGSFLSSTCDSSYSVNIGGIVFNIQNPSGAATLAGASLNGCDSLVNVNITYLPASSGNIMVNTCNDAFTLDINGIIFSKANPQGMVKLPGAASNGCDSLISINIIFTEFDFQLEQEVICNTENGRVTITGANGNGPWSLITNGIPLTTFSELPFMAMLPSGKSILTLSNTESCSATKEIDLPSGIAPEATLTQNLLPDGNIQLNIQPDASVFTDFIWTPDGNLSCNACSDPIVINPVNGQTVSVNYTYSGICKDELQIVLLKDEPGSIILPNIFRPLSNGDNNYFYVQLPEKMNATVQSMRIFDRWGNMVKEISNVPANVPSEGWDGTYKTSGVVPGVYGYYIILNIEGEEKETVFYGDVTIVR